MLTKFPVEHLKNLYVTTSKDSELQSHYAKYPMYKCFFVCQSLKSFNLGIILPFKDSLQMVFTPVFIIILFIGLSWFHKTWVTLTKLVITFELSSIEYSICGKTLLSILKCPNECLHFVNYARRTWKISCIWSSFQIKLQTSTYLLWSYVFFVWFVFPH